MQDDDKGGIGCCFIPLEGLLIGCDKITYNKYPTYFMIWKPKTSLCGHPLILGRSWLAFVDAYLRYRSRSMTILHGTSIEHLTLYPLAKAYVDSEIPICTEEEDSDEEGEVFQVLFIVQYLVIHENIEDDEINDFIAYSSPSNITHTFDHIL